MPFVADGSQLVKQPCHDAFGVVERYTKRLRDAIGSFEPYAPHIERQPVWIRLHDGAGLLTVDLEHSPCQLWGHSVALKQNERRALGAML